LVGISRQPKGHPQGHRRPRFSLSSALVKKQRPHPKTGAPPKPATPQGCQDLEAVWPPAPQNRAADDPYLGQLATFVNAFQRLFADLLKGFLHHTKYS
jgi:hypothetical protein